MELKRRFGVIIVCGIPAIVGSGLLWALSEKWALVFCYLFLLVLSLLVFLVVPQSITSLIQLLNPVSDRIKGLKSKLRESFIGQSDISGHLTRPLPPLAFFPSSHANKILGIPPLPTTPYLVFENYDIIHIDSIGKVSVIRSFPFIREPHDFDYDVFETLSHLASASLHFFPHLLWLQSRR